MSQLEIDRVLAQIRAISAQTGAGAARATRPEESGPSQFATLLRQGLDQVNAAQQRAGELAAAFEEAAAAELGYDALVAPLTFTSIFGYMAQLAFLHHAGISVNDSKIVQVDQELRYLKPITAGDKLFCDVYCDSVRRSFGTDIVVLKSVVTDENGEVVQETYTTLAGRAGDDGEKGFADGSA